MPQKADILASISHEKFKLVIEKLLNFIAQLLCEPCVRSRAHTVMKSHGI